MKIFINKLLLLFTATFLMTSCDSEYLAELNPNASTTVSLSKSDVVLEKDNAGQDALTVSWTMPDYGFEAGADYKIIFTSGDKSATVTIGNSLSKVFETVELNKLLLGLGLKAGTVANVTVEIKAVLSVYSSISSNIETFTANVYQDKLDLITNWGVVGSGYNNWGADGADFPFYKTDDENVLVTYVTLIDGLIKFRTDNSWGLNYGDNGNDGTLEEGGADIPVTAGTYKITFNTATLKYTKVLLTWGIVGDGTPIGWPNGNPGDANYVADQKLTYDSYSNTWKVIIALKDGNIKFRQNNDWSVNYGDAGNNGVLDAGGADIPVTAGKYLITVDFNSFEYSLKPLDHIWGIVGDGTPIGWPNGNPGDANYVADQNLTLDYSTDDVWIINKFVLKDGKVKFRADNDWGTNYGDTGLDGNLDAGGDDIPVTAGRYDIRMDLSNASAPTYTITPTVTY